MNLPQWVTPALAFNNTTSLPLLLVQSLQSTGILDSLDASSDAVDRAKSYFLVNAMVSNSLTFALGPRLLNGQEEDSPDEEPEKDEQDEEQAERASIHEHQEENEETSLLSRAFTRRTRNLQTFTIHSHLALKLPWTSYTSSATHL